MYLIKPGLQVLPLQGNADLCQKSNGIGHYRQMGRGKLLWKLQDRKVHSTMPSPLPSSHGNMMHYIPSFFVSKRTEVLISHLRHKVVYVEIF